MIEFQNVSIHFGHHDVLSDVNFRIGAGERVGIVGPNGAGKSTLFKMLLGECSPDSGRVSVAGDPVIGVVAQHPEPAHSGESLIEYALRGAARVRALEEKILKAEEAGDLKLVGELQTRFEHLGGYDIEARIKAALGGLGFAAARFDKPFASLSGGWRMRAELARILASSPEVLLLDEPSNYLDLPAVEWLQRFLRNFAGTLLLISHDRYLLRTLTKATLEVDAGTATFYPGDLDYYLHEREARTATLVAAKANQDRRREQLERFVERFKAQATKASQAQSRIKMLEKMEEIRLPKRSMSAGKLRIAPAPHSGAEVMRLENVSFAYPNGPEIIRNLSLRINRGDRVALVGFNGLGKTTLLRLMAEARKPTAGEVVVGHKVKIGYQSQEFAETIPPDLSVFECARRALPKEIAIEKDLRAQLGSFGFSADDIEKSAGVLSGGERIRLAFLRLFLDPPNFLLLDEPTTHLDLEGRQSLQDALNEYNGTICFVSHDVEFVKAMATRIVEFTEAGVKEFNWGYEDYIRNAEMLARKFESLRKTSSSETTSSAALRRERAAIRAKWQAKIKPLAKKVEDAEAKIGILENEEKELSEKLSGGAEGIDFAALGSRLREVQFELGKLALEWEEAAESLESLRAEMQAEIDA